MKPTEKKKKNPILENNFRVYNELQKDMGATVENWSKENFLECQIPSKITPPLLYLFSLVTAV